LIARARDRWRKLAHSRAPVLNESFAGSCTILRIDAVPSEIHSTAAISPTLPSTIVNRSLCLRQRLETRRWAITHWRSGDTREDGATVTARRVLHKWMNAAEWEIPDSYMPRW